MKDSILNAPSGEEARPSALLTAEERYNRIAEAAYLRAAARGFVGGDAMQDWLAAEAELMKSGDQDHQDPSQSTEEERQR